MLDLPLLNPDTPAPFTRKTKGRPPIHGRVYSQYQDQDRKHLTHPSVFYVEFPESIFHEISSRRLAAILGDGASARSFHRIEIARTLESIHSTMDLKKLIPNLAPPNP